MRTMDQTGNTGTQGNKANTASSKQDMPILMDLHQTRRAGNSRTGIQKTAAPTLGTRECREKT